jgi:uncharacterized protein YndB with AHSA1/START domain
MNAGPGLKFSAGILQLGRMAMAGFRIRRWAIAMLIGTCAAAGQASGQTPASAPQLASPDSNPMLLAQEWTVLEVTPPPIRNSVVLNTPVANAWAMWTDSKRAVEFLCFEATIEPTPGGKYQAVFVREATAPLERGNDGRVVAIEPQRMLSFTWMTPMGAKALTGNSTLVTLYFIPLDGGKRTQIDLVNTGYGLGPDWKAAYAYNVKGWDNVLSHLQQAAEFGPIDWNQRAKDMKRDGTLPMWRSFKRKQMRGENPWPKRTP